MPDRRVPSLDDFIDLASFILDAPPEAVRRLHRLSLAESALHAPFASFGGTAAYPSLTGQAAVLIEHLAQNHPLPDGNKRTAFLTMLRFLDANGLRWGSQDVETDAGMVERVAAGAIPHAEVVDWIAARTRPETNA
jgi:death-on-curing protein